MAALTAKQKRLADKAATRLANNAKTDPATEKLLRDVAQNKPFDVKHLAAAAGLGALAGAKREQRVQRLERNLKRLEGHKITREELNQGLGKVGEAGLWGALIAAAGYALVRLIKWRLQKRREKASLKESLDPERLRRLQALGYDPRAIVARRKERVRRGELRTREARVERSKKAIALAVLIMVRRRYPQDGPWRLANFESQLGFGEDRTLYTSALYAGARRNFSIMLFEPHEDAQQNALLYVRFPSGRSVREDFNTKRVNAAMVLRALSRVLPPAEVQESSDMERLLRDRHRSAKAVKKLQRMRMRQGLAGTRPARAQVIAKHAKAWETALRVALNRRYPNQAPWALRNSATAGSVHWWWFTPKSDPSSLSRIRVRLDRRPLEDTSHLDVGGLGLHGTEETLQTPTPSAMDLLRAMRRALPRAIYEAVSENLTESSAAKRQIAQNLTRNRDLLRTLRQSKKTGKLDAKRLLKALALSATEGAVAGAIARVVLTSVAGAPMSALPAAAKTGAIAGAIVWPVIHAVGAAFEKWSRRRSQKRLRQESAGEAPELALDLKALADAIAKASQHVGDEIEAYAQGRGWDPEQMTKAQWKEAEKHLKQHRKAIAKKAKAGLFEDTQLREAAVPLGTVHRWSDGKDYVKTEKGWVKLPTRIALKDADIEGSAQALQKDARTVKRLKRANIALAITGVGLAGVVSALGKARELAPQYQGKEMQTIGRALHQAGGVPIGGATIFKSDSATMPPWMLKHLKGGTMTYDNAQKFFNVFVQKEHRDVITKGVTLYKSMPELIKAGALGSSVMALGMIGMYAAIKAADTLLKRVNSKSAEIKTTVRKPTLQTEAAEPQLKPSERIKAAVEAVVLDTMRRYPPDELIAVLKDPVRVREFEADLNQAIDGYLLKEPIQESSARDRMRHLRRLGFDPAASRVRHRDRLRRGAPTINSMLFTESISNELSESQAFYQGLFEETISEGIPTSWGGTAGDGAAGEAASLARHVISKAKDLGVDLSPLHKPPPIRATLSVLPSGTASAAASRVKASIADGIGQALGPTMGRILMLAGGSVLAGLLVLGTTAVYAAWKHMQQRGRNKAEAKRVAKEVTSRVKREIKHSDLKNPNNAPRIARKIQHITDDVIARQA